MGSTLRNMQHTTDRSPDISQPNNAPSVWSDQSASNQ